MTVFMVLLIDRNLYKSISKNQGFLLNGLLSSLSNIFGDKQCHFNFLKRSNSIRIIYYYNHFSWPRPYFCKDTYQYQKLKINHQYVVKTPIFFPVKGQSFEWFSDTWFIHTQFDFTSFLSHSDTTYIFFIDDKKNEQKCVFIKTFWKSHHDNKKQKRQNFIVHFLLLKYHLTLHLFLLFLKIP